VPDKFRDEFGRWKSSIGLGLDWKDTAFVYVPSSGRGKGTQKVPEDFSQVLKQVLRENVIAWIVSYIGIRDKYDHDSLGYQGTRTEQLEVAYRRWVWEEGIPTSQDEAGPGRGYLAGFKIVTQRIGPEYTCTILPPPYPPRVQATAGKDWECFNRRLPLFVDDHAGVVAALAEIGVDAIAVRTPDASHRHWHVRAANSGTAALRSILEQVKSTTAREELLRRQRNLLRPEDSAKHRFAGSKAEEKIFDDKLLDAINIDELEFFYKSDRDHRAWPRWKEEPYRTSGQRR